MEKNIFSKKTILPGVTAMAAVFLLASVASPGKGMAREQAGDQGYTLEEITVTAQKQEENVQEVPVSMTVINGMELEDFHIGNVWDLMEHVPGLMNFDVGMSDMFAQPSMRGISAPASSFASSVGLYVDGVPALASPGFATNLLDIERIEVLRGPQGTLYGKNTEAGAINIVTRQPGNEWTGKLGAEYGEDNKYLLLANVSGPVAQDTLFFSLTGQYEQKDGFLTNNYLGGTNNDRNRLYGRGQLRWTPSANWDISLILSRLASDEGGGPQIGNKAMFDRFGLPMPAEERNADCGLRPEKETYIDTQALKIVYDINEDMSITSITARRMTDWDAVADYDFSPMPIFHMYQDSSYSNLSQEIRFNWKTSRWKGLAGLYADNHMNDIEMGNVLPDDSRLATTKREISGDSWSLFGQTEYSITDALRLIAGLRYERQNMDYEDDLLVIDTDESWEKMTPKIGLQYRLSPQTNIYASVAEGYRTGGFNHTATDPEHSTFDPEKLWNYELGVKTSFLENRILVSASVYYMDIEDMQVEEFVTPITTYVTNAAQATAKGAEIELSAKVTKGLTLNAGVSYNDTTFDEFKDAKGDYSGNKNPFAPEYTFNAGAIYRHGSGFFLAADIVGYGSIYIDNSNTNKRDAYQLVNAKIGYEFDRFDMYLYARNLFDTDYTVYNYYGYYNTYSPPREIGLRLTYRF